MEVKEFIKSVLIQLDQAVDEARGQTQRDIRFKESDDKRTVEFDIAVTAEDKLAASGKAGIKVVSFIEAGGNTEKEVKNATVSRIQFGLTIDSMTRQENSDMHAQTMAHNNRSHSGRYM